MTTQYSIPLLIAVIALVPSAELMAKERTAEEFKEYASRRIAKVDDDQLDAFVTTVDKDADGTISAKEFAARIDVFQKIFKSIQPTHGGGHDLPENWLTDFDEARKQSTESGKPILAMFSASWCGPCKAMIARVYPTDEAKKALEAFVPVYIDSEKQRELASKNDIRAFPTFVCFDSEGDSVEQYVGGGDVEEFVAMLETFKIAATKSE